MIGFLIWIFLPCVVLVFFTTRWWQPPVTLSTQDSEGVRKSGSEKSLPLRQRTGMRARYPEAKECPEIYSLRWKLAAAPIQPHQAKEILNLDMFPADANIFDVVLLRQSRELLHVCTSSHEYIVIRHRYRHWVAWFEVLPFSATPAKMQRASEHDFWSTHPHLFEVILQNYRKFRALRKIAQCSQLNDWIDAPISRDGKVGIRCRMGWRDIVDNQIVPTSDK